MSKVLTLVAVLSTICLSTTAVAQGSPYTLDALKYSTQRFGGTARIQGLAGAQTALGGDISNLAGNPAGLGFYNKSEFSLSPALNFISSESMYLGENHSEKKVNFNFNNLGVVLANVKDDVEEGAFRGGSFAIGLTRLSNYHNDITYSGTNNNNSIIDFFIEEMNSSGTTVQQLDDFISASDLRTPSELAYGAFLIDYFPSDSVYDSYVLPDPVRQQEKITVRGAQYQMDFGYGGNISDRFYFGAGLGLQTIRHERTRTYTEVVQNSSSILNSLSYEDKLEVDGNGVNLNLGLIYRINDYVRVGASYRSPTWYNLEETFSSSLSADYNDFVYYYASGDSAILTSESSSSSILEDSYKFQNPSRITGGISVFAGKNGFLSADVEYVNYSGASFNFSNSAATEQEINDEISSLLTNTVNIRVGGEYRADILRFRAGYANYGSPFSKQTGINKSTQHYTVGTGVRMPNYYFDLAVVHSRGNQSYSPYSLNSGLEPVAEVENRATNVVLTFGSYF